MEWDGEDWSSLRSNNMMIRRKSASSKVFDETAHNHHTHKEGLSLGNLQKKKLLEAVRAASNYDADIDGTVKIKMTKKELVELLGGIEKQKEPQVINKRKIASSAEQVLFRLMKARDEANNRHQGFWRPVLESIPEVS
ncbi:hypothetical protein RJT34_32096 [Clitoria ternatea]|uniref:Uncharacterized protein n=1 Tax=Clitoria ternatea TaxID=43366 RepID=A0AAN9I3F7_CLITE